MAAYFKPRFYRWGRAAGVYENRIIKNSETIKTGGLVKLSSGFVAAATAGARIWGLCVGIVGGVSGKNDGIPLDKQASGADYDGTYTAGPLGTQTYAAASDNQTDKQVKAVIDVSPDLVMSNTPDATIGTTSGSNLAGNYTDIVSDVQVDEDNNSAALTTIAQLVILGVDPEDSTSGLYMIMENQASGG